MWLLSVFRLADDGTCADERDMACAIDHFPRIGLVRPTDAVLEGLG